MDVPLAHLDRPFDYLVPAELADDDEQSLWSGLLDEAVPASVPIIAFLEYGGDREYYLASAADRVIHMRDGMVVNDTKPGVPQP